MAIHRQEAVKNDKNNSGTLGKMALLVMFIVGAVYLVRFSPASHYLTEQQLGLVLDGAGIWLL